MNNFYELWMSLKLSIRPTMRLTVQCGEVIRVRPVIDKATLFDINIRT